MNKNNWGYEWKHIFTKPRVSQTNCGIMNEWMFFYTGIFVKLEDIFQTQLWHNEWKFDIIKSTDEEYIFGHISES